MAQNEQFMFKRGIAVFPALARPDTRYIEEGVYKSDVKLKEDVAASLIKDLSAAYKAHVGKPHPKRPTEAKAGPLFYFETDDEGDETGYVIFKIRAKNITRKDGELWDKKPKIIDGKKNVVGDDVNPWGGSILSVKADLYLWTFNTTKGASLQPMVVQIHELVTGGEVNLDDFDEDDDGYEAEDSEFDSDDDNPETGDDEDY